MKTYHKNSQFAKVHNLWSTSFVMKKKRSGQAFWDAEYKEGGHLALSMNPSEDLEKFTRWLIREEGQKTLNVMASVLDIGCGNGRNLLWLGEAFGIHGTGYDISAVAVRQANQGAKTRQLSLSFDVLSLTEAIPLPDDSQTIVLDMMVSHFLNREGRERLVREIHRVLRPGGYLFYKTFLLDEDKHAERMITENPGGEENTYIHPKIGVAEHVSSLEEIEVLYSQYFTIHKVYKSHRHKGKHAKRRSVSVYMEKTF